MRKFKFLIILLFVLCVVPTFAQNSKVQQKEKLEATVIAEYSFPLCFYHPCFVELIIRFDQDKKKQSSYARVTVEYFPVVGLPNKGFPSELVEKTKKWKFNATRDASQDAAIEKYLKVVDSKTKKDISEEVAAPAWKLLPGVESEGIPVGEVLPYYFVKSRDYKEIREWYRAI